MEKPYNYKNIKKLNISNGVKVLGIAASPRQNGNSEILLDKVLEGASSKGASTEKIVIDQLSIKPCQGCGRCHKNGICFIRDDMRRMYKKLQDADAIVVASPVYFGSITAQLKIMVDRCQCIWAKNFLLKNRRQKQVFKNGIFISVSGHNKRRFFQNSKEIVKIFFAVLGVVLFKELYVPNLEHKGDVLKKRSILDKAFRYGMSLTESIEKKF